MPEPPPPPYPRAAYGLRLGGPVVAPPVGDQLLTAGGDDLSASWPGVIIDAAVGDDVSDGGCDGERVCRPFSYGACYLVERSAGRATFTGPQRPGGDVVVHPGLTGVGAAFARWLGRPAFHAGGLIAGGGAWGIVGAKGRGKTTLLAALACRGHQILSDDFLVLDGEMAFAGPRTLDLRPDAHAVLGSPATIGVRNGERRRLLTGPVPLAVPLRGWIELVEARSLALEPVAPADRLGVIAPHAARPVVPARPATLLDLATLPVWRLRRPTQPWALPASAEVLEPLLR